MAGADPAGWLRLDVRTPGRASPPTSSARIFDEFAQLRNPERDRTKGTGLGLAICRRLVEGVGGRLTVGERAGRGQRLHRDLPARPPPPTSARPPEVAAASRPTATAADGRSTILLVEDDDQ